MNHTRDQAQNDPASSNPWFPWNWRLPLSHRYETYDPRTGQAYAVDDATVAAPVARGEWIFDRSANGWVSGPADGPASKDDCKQGGWSRFTNPRFKNQGQCVSHVNGRR